MNVVRRTMKSGEGAKLEDSEEERLKKEEAFKQVRKRQLAHASTLKRDMPAPSEPVGVSMYATP